MVGLIITVALIALSPVPFPAWLSASGIISESARL
jgi:hypothetical protein